MNDPIYPLKFEPVYQYRIWGGRKLGNFLSKPLPHGDPIGEAWILSDRKDHVNRVSEGKLKGTSLTDLMKNYRDDIMGKAGDRFERFPLLLKFLDSKTVLSVQVHPSDNQKKYIPKNESGKTEAWVVLETAEDSRIYAGLRKGTTKEELLQAIQEKRIVDKLHSFIPEPGDAVFIQSGTVHTLKGTVVFEVQENSDVTYRLYDWDRKDPKTGKFRDLQLDEAMACIDFNQTDINPVRPEKNSENKHSEKLFDNEHFKVWRLTEQSSFQVGKINEPVILVGLEGKGKAYYNDHPYNLQKGEVILLPAVTGPLEFHPDPQIKLLQVTISNGNKSNKS